MFQTDDVRYYIFLNLFYGSNLKEKNDPHLTKEVYI